MIAQIFDLDCFKILSVFALAPGMRLRRQELKQKTKLNNVPLDGALARLASAKILLKEKKLFVVNFENVQSKPVISLISQQYKMMRELPLDVYFFLLDVSNKLTTTTPIELWLFGSYAKLIYKENSDVDIALLAPKNFDKEFAIKLMQKFEKKYDKNIELHVFDKARFYKNKRDPLVKEILRAGLRLI